MEICQDKDRILLNFPTFERFNSQRSNTIPEVYDGSDATTFLWLLGLLSNVSFNTDGMAEAWS